MKPSSRWQWLLRTLVRQLWFRASLFSLLAVAVALFAWLAEPWIPEGWPRLAGSDAVDGILGILASSMLTVTVFSLTTMVSSYAAASSNVTPRATRLLLEDSTSQNALSTFLGAFLFSLVGIIALSTGRYGEGGRAVLFVATLLVVVVIVLTLLRWISHLSTLGQVGDSIARVEQAASGAFDERAAQPYLGGVPSRAVPARSVPVHADQVGYVQHVDMEALSDAADTLGAIDVAVVPGSFVHTSQPLAWVESKDGIPDDDRQRIQSAFLIDAARTFGQDPRFGLIVLSEIASRALSPAVNDPGTAIAVLGAGVRVLDRWGRRDGKESEAPFPRVHVAGLSADDLFDDLFAPIARDGAATVEVGVRLQKALAALAAIDEAEMQRAARRLSARALEQAGAALVLESDRRRLAELAKDV